MFGRDVFRSRFGQVRGGKELEVRVGAGVGAGEGNRTLLFSLEGFDR
jgi:hypothetical protein